MGRAPSLCAALCLLAAAAAQAQNGTSATAGVLPPLADAAETPMQSLRPDMAAAGQADPAAAGATPQRLLEVVRGYIRDEVSGWYETDGKALLTEALMRANDTAADADPLAAYQASLNETLADVADVVAGNLDREIAALAPQFDLAALNQLHKDAADELARQGQAQLAVGQDFSARLSVFYAQLRETIAAVCGADIECVVQLLTPMPRLLESWMPALGGSAYRERLNRSAQNRRKIKEMMAQISQEKRQTAELQTTLDFINASLQTQNKTAGGGVSQAADVLQREIERKRGSAKRLAEEMHRQRIQAAYGNDTSAISALGRYPAEGGGERIRGFWIGVMTSDDEGQLPYDDTPTNFSGMDTDEFFRGSAKEEFDSGPPPQKRRAESDEVADGDSDAGALPPRKRRTEGAEEADGDSDDGAPPRKRRAEGAEETDGDSDDRAPPRKRSGEGSEEADGDRRYGGGRTDNDTMREQQPYLDEDLNGYTNPLVPQISPDSAEVPKGNAPGERTPLFAPPNSPLNSTDGQSLPQESYPGGGRDQNESDARRDPRSANEQLPPIAAAAASPAVNNTENYPSSVLPNITNATAPLAAVLDQGVSAASALVANSTGSTAQSEAGSTPSSGIPPLATPLVATDAVTGGTIGGQSSAAQPLAAPAQAVDAAAQPSSDFAPTVVGPADNAITTVSAMPVAANTAPAASENPPSVPAADAATTAMARLLAKLVQEREKLLAQRSLFNRT